MKKILGLSAFLSFVLSAYAHAEARRKFELATVVSVETHETPSNYIRDNPTDAPLQAEVHAYDIGVQLDCTVYTVRYESALDYLPPVFAANHGIDVNLQKHVMKVALPGDRDVKLGIVYRTHAADASCLAGR